MEDEKELSAVRAEFKKKYSELIQTLDLKRPATITTKTFDREKLRVLLKAPSTDANQKSLRQLSDYLVSVSFVYKRLVDFYSRLMDCVVWTAAPLRDNTKMNRYMKAAGIVRNFNMKRNIVQFSEDLILHGVTYGFVRGDASKEPVTIQRLDPDYCRVAGITTDGVLGVAFNFGYFNGKESQLECYDPIFATLFATSKTTNQNWQLLPLESSFCLKLDLNKLDWSMPFLSGLFESIIGLTDIQAAQDAQDLTTGQKLIWGFIDTIAQTKEPDDYAVSLDLALKFLDMINEALPSSIGTCVSPMKLEAIDLGGDSADPTNGNNVVAKSYQNIVNANGAIVLDNTRITNSTAFKLALKASCLQITRPVYEQVNAFIMHQLRCVFGITDVAVEFDSTPSYFRPDRVEELTKLAQYGVPVKMHIAAIEGMDVVEMVGYDRLEHMLGLTETMWDKPIQNVNQISSEELSETELTDEGEKSRDRAGDGTEAEA